MGRQGGVDGVGGAQQRGVALVGQAPPATEIARALAVGEVVGGGVVVVPRPSRALRLEELRDQVDLHIPRVGRHVVVDVLDVAVPEEALSLRRVGHLPTQLAPQVLVENLELEEVGDRLVEGGGERRAEAIRLLLPLDVAQRRRHRPMLGPRQRAHLFAHLPRDTPAPMDDAHAFHLPHGLERQEVGEVHVHDGGRRPPKVARRATAADPRKRP